MHTFPQQVDEGGGPGWDGLVAVLVILAVFAAVLLVGVRVP